MVVEGWKINGRKKTGVAAEICGSRHKECDWFEMTGLRKRPPALHRLRGVIAAGMGQRSGARMGTVKEAEEMRLASVGRLTVI